MRFLPYCFDPAELTLPVLQFPSSSRSTRRSASSKNSRPTKSTCTRSSSTSFFSPKPVRLAFSSLSVSSLTSDCSLRHSFRLQALPSTMEAAAKVPQGGLRALRRGASPFFPFLCCLQVLTPCTLGAGLSHHQDAVAQPGGSRYRLAQEVRFLSFLPLSVIPAHAFSSSPYRFSELLITPYVAGQAVL